MAAETIDDIGGGDRIYLTWQTFSCAEIPRPLDKVAISLAHWSGRNRSAREQDGRGIGVRVYVEPEALAAVGAALSAPTAPPVAAPAAAPGADGASVGGASVLAGHQTVLGLLIGHAQALQTSGGLSVTGTATTLRGTDETNAGWFSGTSTAAASDAVAAATPVLPTGPDFPPIPAMPPLPPGTGEMHAIAFHSGTGSSGLRAFAASCRAQAAELHTAAATLQVHGASIDAAWWDGAQQAGSNTTRLGTWHDSTGRYTTRLAATAEQIADHYDRIAAQMPTEADFQAARDRMVSAAATGNMPGFMQARADMNALQSRSFELITDYHSAVAASTAALGNPPPAAPPINRDGTVRPLDNGTGEEPPPDPQPPVRGLPPKGVHPPVPGDLTPGPASRPSEAGKGGQSLWDENGGEWRFFPGDKWHNPHWDYNPHNAPNSPWDNVPIGGLPHLKDNPSIITGLPPWLQNPAAPGVPGPPQNPLLAPFPGAEMPTPAPAPSAGPVDMFPHVDLPAPNPADLENAGATGTGVVAGGGLLALLYMLLVQN